MSSRLYFPFFERSKQRNQKKQQRSQILSLCRPHYLYILYLPFLSLNPLFCRFSLFTAAIDYFCGNNGGFFVRSRVSAASPGKILVFVISGSNLFRNRPGIRDAPCRGNLDIRVCMCVRLPVKLGSREVHKVHKGADIFAVGDYLESSGHETTREWKEERASLEKLS